MESCTGVDGLLTAYVDGEASAAEQAVVGEHLAACPPCSRHAAAEQEARRIVRTRAETLRGEASDELRARCLALAVPRGPAAEAIHTSWWRAVSLAVATMIAAGAVLVSAVTPRSPSALATQLALDHMKCFGLFAGSDSVDAAATVAQLGNYGCDVVVPESGGPDGLRLVGARRCLYFGGVIAHLMYRMHRRPISLFVLPGTARRSGSVRALGHEAVIWSGRDRTFVLPGRESRPVLERVAAHLGDRLR